MAASSVSNVTPPEARTLNWFSGQMRIPGLGVRPDESAIMIGFGLRPAAKL